jgi:hypothetical protein
METAPLTIDKRPACGGGSSWAWDEVERSIRQAAAAIAKRNFLRI